jgi:hypothetical protein
MSSRIGLKPASSKIGLIKPIKKHLEIFNLVHRFSKMGEVGLREKSKLM